MKKVQKSVLAITLTAAMLAGCAAPANSSSSGTASASGLSQNANLTPEGTFPIVKDKITLTYWVSLNEKYSATIKNFNELESQQKIEEKTNIHIEFQHPVDEVANEQFNLMLASKSLPDIIEKNWTGVPGGPEKALADGVIVDMTDLIEQHAPNYKKVLDSTPVGKAEAGTSDGRQYMMTGFYLGDANAIKVMIGPQIRHDWLDKLNLKAPTTIKEWHDVLTAIKTKDPNGNGTADEIPFISKGASITCSNDNINVFASAWGLNMKFFNVDKTVKFGPYEPEFKEYLATMNQWYNEGLIDPEFATTDKNLFDAKIFNGQAGSWFAGLMGDLGRYVKYCDEETADWNITGVTYPVYEKTGKGYNFAGGLNDTAMMTGANITTSNKYPVETTRWLDYTYTEEGHWLDVLGVEGSTYNMVDGKPVFTDKVLNNPNGWDFTRAMAHYARAAGSTGARMPEVALYTARSNTPQQLEARDVLWGSASAERTLPSLTPSSDVSQRQSEILNGVFTYVDEMILKFIMGVEPISQFDNYIATLKQMGIEEAIAIQQKAFDAYNAKYQSTNK